MHVYMHECVCIYIIYVCMYVCIYVCMYVNHSVVCLSLNQNETTLWSQLNFLNSFLTFFLSFFLCWLLIHDALPV